MEQSLGLGKKSSGPKTDTETLSWFRLPIPKPGFGRTLPQGDPVGFQVYPETLRRFRMTPSQ